MEYNMKLEQKTLNVITNFSRINPSLLFREGSVLRTISPTKTIIGKAKISNEFPTKFAIYNLPQFLGILSLVENYQMKFNDRSVKIYNGTTAIDYYFADEDNIKTPPEKDLVLKSVDVTFDLKHSAIMETVKGASILGLTDIAVVGNGTKICIKAFDVKGTTDNNFSIEIGETDKTFQIVYKSENLMKILESNYHVEACVNGITHWTAKDIEYWIMAEASSTYKG
jgi:gp45 sliding clamp, C terminal